MSTETRHRYVETILGLNYEAVERIAQTLGRWAYLTQRRYFTEALNLITSSADASVLPPVDAFAQLKTTFEEFESLRKQSERAREALKLFQSAVVPPEFESKPPSADGFLK